MKNRNIVIKIVIIVWIVPCLFFLWACSGSTTKDKPNPDSGALTFQISYDGDADNNHWQVLALDCNKEGIKTIEASVYDQDNSLIVRGGPWSCDERRGTIHSVPAGNNRSIVILAMNSDGHIVFRGEKSNIDVVGNHENSAGIIECHAFSPILYAPVNGVIVNSNSMLLEWNDVIGAINYQVIVSENDDLSNSLITESSTTSDITLKDLSNTMTYYWQISAFDNENKIGAGSEIWSFTVEMDLINTAPIAEISSPAQGSRFTASDVVTFTGIGIDSEDGDLVGDSLVWSSDVDGEIGIGETFDTKLLVSGIHQITLTVSDSEGSAGSDSIEITIPTGRIPDTGQHSNQFKNYHPAPDEDMSIIMIPPAYTKIDSSGNELDENATDWAMVRDDVTGLVWEIKAIGDDSDIHNNENKYQWHNIEDEFITPLNDSNFGGHSDWRMPTNQELYSILNNINVRPNPKINITYFPHTKSSEMDAYWTSTRYASNSEQAWWLNFYHGHNFFDDISNSHYVRAVRGGQHTNDYDKNSEDTVVIDKATGLMWQQIQAGATKIDNWQSALDYCAKLELAGYDDWRLPNVKELQSIVSYSQSSPSIDESSFRNTQWEFYWSSTTFANDTSIAWLVYFKDGRISTRNKDSRYYYVRAVRGGQ